MKYCSLEVGSDFEWMDVPESSLIPWPKPGIWYTSGQEALLSVWDRHLLHNPDSILFVPDYFGPDVPGAWKSLGVKMRFYSDDPR